MRIWIFQVVVHEVWNIIRGFDENLINSTYFRTEDPRPNEGEIVSEHATTDGVRVEGRTGQRTDCPAKIRYFEFFSLIFAQILMKFCRNFADNLENVEIF